MNISNDQNFYQSCHKAKHFELRLTLLNVLFSNSMFSLND